MITLDARFRFTGERRQVTALFYDIVGSTELLLKSEPEQFFRSLSALHQAAEKVIKKHGGFLHQRLGDGGCCFFGYPDQTEDAAEGAVQAALDLLKIAAKPKPKSRKPFRLRVGIATSLVVFSAEGGDIVGTAPILAARLQAEAEPESVLVADSTFQLTRTRFDYTLLRNAKLKGFSDPIALWRPNERIAHGPTTPFPVIDRPTIGRETELSSLFDAWNATCDGHGKSVAIVGEAGIGKSKLVAEFIRRLGDGDHKTRVFQCSRRMESQPLHPFIGFLETLVEPSVLKSGDQNAFLQALQLSGRIIEPRVADSILAFTAERSSVTSGNIRVSDLSGRAFRKEVVEASSRILVDRTRAVPTLLVFEDVHWADGMTVELIDHLGLLAGKLPILLIQTSRIRRSLAAASEIALPGLTTDAVRDLVASIWSSPPPPGLSDFILGQCDGMPLYAEELADFFRDKRDAGKKPSEWREMLLEGGVTTLNDLLSARLASVGSARRVAQFASVIGREFSAAILSHLLKADKRRIDAELALLLMQGVIERSPDASGSYRFRHVLMQEAAYGSLLKSDRRRIHRLIANLLIEENIFDIPTSVAAWQCAEAGRHDAATKFALTAAESSVLRSAMQEASVSLDVCAREIKRIPYRHPEREDLLISLLKLQGVVATALEGEGSHSARRTYSRAMQLLRKHSSSVRESHFPIYWGWWFTAPNILAQQSRARILIEDMQSVEDSETQLQSYHCGWATSFHAGEHSFCLDCVAKGLELYDPSRALKTRAFFGGHDAKVCALGESALSYLLLDQLGASEDAITKCLNWAASTDHIGSMVHGLYYAIVLRRCQGKYDEVGFLGERMRSLAERHGLVASLARANMYCGWAEFMTSPLETGAKRFQDALLLQKQLGTDDNLSIHSDMHAQVLERLGNYHEAFQVIQNAINVGRKSGQWFWLAELYRRSAELRHLLGDEQTTIRQDLTKAMRFAVGQGASWLVARANHDLDKLSASSTP
ncbi:AAA family ATPase [Rhizobium leguminosarum bv. trifolii]|nr:AAA family ATPase [Rhizobium leguminosarum bv. trifolii]